MAGMTSSAPPYLLRSNLWSSQLKDVLYADLQAQGYVDWMSDFPDGTTFNIPSIGTLEVDNYVEDTPVKYRALSTGNFTFTITEYLSSATYITEKDRQDSFYASMIESQFVPKEHRALMERLEADIFKLGMAQTTSNKNSINGADHRWIASGTNQTMDVTDFARARYALKKANVPDRNLMAIVDPSVEFKFNTLPNLVNFSMNPKWEGIVTSGIASGLTFVKNIFGFDVYSTQYLADANETITASNGVTDTTAAGKCNMFFSADSAVKPFKGAWRQMPKVDSSYNKDYQREEYVTTCRYGVKLFRPENLVCVLSDTDQV